MRIADMVSKLTAGVLPLRFEAYDGSGFGPTDSGITMRLNNERGLRYLATAPGDLGMARAYVRGDLDLEGIHPGDPYDALKVMGRWRFRRPTAAEIATLVREMGWRRLVPPEPPAAALAAPRRRVDPTPL
jgi:cyclopropane-fatty-acyl-phospholipid synthase